MNIRFLRVCIIATSIWLGITLIGCGGGGGGSSSVVGNPPTATTKTHLGEHLSALGSEQVANTFTAFNHNTAVPKRPTLGGPTYVTGLGLWMSISVSGSSLTESFFQDQAETEPAGSATYNLNLSTLTLSGTYSITKGTYAGLSGTYSQSVSANGTTGTSVCNLPNGTNISSQFSVVIGSTGTATGTGTQTVTLANGYSETSNVTYNADGSTVIQSSDSNGYSSTLDFTSTGAGKGTISGPDPGLPAVLAWNSSGTGTATFANGSTVTFTNWQIPNF